MWAASRVFQETMGKRERLEDKNGKRTVVIVNLCLEVILILMLVRMLQLLF